MVKSKTWVIDDCGTKRLTFFKQKVTGRAAIKGLAEAIYPDSKESQRDVIKEFKAELFTVPHKTTLFLNLHAVYWIV